MITKKQILSLSSFSVLFWLGLITLLGLGLRGYQLGQLPGILNRDEAALAYNAFLLQNSGLDEWQRAWPIALESFGDFKLIGYVGVLAGLFKILPTLDWVVRLPSFIAGVFLIPVSFWLSRLLGYRKEHSLLVSFLVAVTPVFVFYSRIAFEANLALFLFVLAITLFIKGSQKSKFSFIFDLAALSAVGLSVLTYNTPLLLLPFLIPLLPLWRGLKNWKGWLWQTLALVAIMGVMFSILLPLTQQKSGITILSDETTWHKSIEYRQQFSGVWQQVLGHKYVYWSGIVIGNIFKSFMPRFLVSDGGSHPWHSLPMSGHIFGIVYGLGLMGLLRSFWESLILLRKKDFWKKKVDSKNLLFTIGAWYLTLVSLLPSVITVDAPHTTRSLLFLWLWLWWAVAGFEWIYDLIKTYSLPKKAELIAFLILIFVSFEILIFGYRYFYQFPSLQPDSLQVGFDESIKKGHQKYAQQPVAIIDEGGFQYIILAWYLQVNPEEYFQTVVRQLPDKIGFRYGEKLLNYHFIAHPSDRSPEEKVWLEWDGHQWLWYD